MTKKRKEFTREDMENGYKNPPFSYSGWKLDEAMKNYDEGEEFHKNHPDKMPENMHQVRFDGFSSGSIDDYISVDCKCGEVVDISGGYISFCPK